MAVAAAAATAVAAASARRIVFGQYELSASQVFMRTQYSLGIVNLSPVVPGHVMVIPKRRTARLAGLTPAEAADLFLAVQRVVAHVESDAAAGGAAPGATVAIQDGAAAGQSVTHVHAHVLPRRPGDFARNDDVYDALEGKAVAKGSASPTATATAGSAGSSSAAVARDIEHESRRKRTAAEMAEEAASLAKHFPDDQEHSLFLPDGVEHESLD